MYPGDMTGHGYYCYPHGPYPYPSGYYDHQHITVESNPYPFHGPYVDIRMVERSHQVGYDRYGRLRRYPYYDPRHCFLGPYTSYREYNQTPLLPYPQPPPPPQVHPFYTPESICTIM